MQKEVQKARCSAPNGKFSESLLKHPSLSYKHLVSAELFVIHVVDTNPLLIFIFVIDFENDELYVILFI